MSNEDFSKKVKEGIALAGQRMLREKALHGESIIVSSDGKTIRHILAEQLLKENRE